MAVPVANDNLDRDLAWLQAMDQAAQDLTRSCARFRIGRLARDGEAQRAAADRIAGALRAIEGLFDEVRAEGVTFGDAPPGAR